MPRATPEPKPQPNPPAAPETAIAAPQRPKKPTAKSLLERNAESTAATKP